MIAWVAVIFSLVGASYVSFHKNIGQLLWVVGNPLWITHFYMIRDLPSIFLFIIYESLAIMGFLTWRRKGIPLI
jgi:nicotinamide riboside transporter PnuC